MLDSQEDYLLLIPRCETDMQKVIKIGKGSDIVPDTLPYKVLQDCSANLRIMIFYRNQREVREEGLSNYGKGIYKNQFSIKMPKESFFNAQLNQVGENRLAGVYATRR